MILYTMDIMASNSFCCIHRVFCQPQVPEKWGFLPRRNRDQHLIYIRRGQGYYLLERKGVLERVDFKPGMVIFVPAGTLHGGYTSNPQNRPRIIPIRFGFYPLGAYIPGETGENSSSMILTPPKEPLIHMTRLSLWWRETFEHIYRIYADLWDTPGTRETCGVLLESLLRVMELECSLPERGFREVRLNHIKKLMDDNCEANCTLNWFARQAGLSEKHFQKLFKGQFGLSPMEFYRQKKMERALLLLQDTRMSLEDVGYRLGYADGFSFSRAFKNFYGISPGRFRN